MRYVLTLVGSAVLVATGASAQVLPLPLVEAARKTVVTNPEVQARWRGFRIADAERGEARAGYLPQLDALAGAGRQNNRRPSGETGWYSYGSAALTLNQMLFDGFFTRNEVQRLGHAKLVRYYELVEASETATLEALRAYVDVIRYRELVEQAKLNYAEHKVTTSQIDERAGAGVGRRVDLEQAVGRLALAESNLLTELANLYDVTARYQRVVGEMPAANLPTLAEGIKLKGLPASLPEAMSLGLSNSPALSAAIENVRASEAGIAARKAAYVPRVDFRASQNWDHNLLGERGRSRDTSIGVVLSYNLYRGGADEARELKAVETKSQALDLQEKACRDLRQNLASSYSESQRLTEQLAFLDQHRLSSEKSREAYRQQFDIGQRTLLDILDTQNEYFQASRAFINARYNQIIAQARALASMGKLMTALEVSRPDMPSLAEAGRGTDGSNQAAELCAGDLPPMVTVEQAKVGVDVTPRQRARPLPAGDQPGAAPAPRK